MLPRVPEGDRKAAQAGAVKHQRHRHVACRHARAGLCHEIQCFVYWLPATVGMLVAGMRCLLEQNPPQATCVRTAACIMGIGCGQVMGMQ